MIDRIKSWLSGLKIPVGMYILAFLLVFSFIAVSCQGLFNLNASDSEVTLVDSLKGGSNEGVEYLFRTHHRHNTLSGDHRDPSGGA